MLLQNMLGGEKCGAKTEIGHAMLLSFYIGIE